MIVTSTATASTTIDQTTIAAAKAKIVEVCPVRWEDHSQSLVLPTLASDVIWADADDRAAFVAYMTTLLAQIGSTDNSEIIADDVGSVAAECATQRTALLDMLLVKEPNDIIIGMRAMKRSLDELALAGKDGLNRDTAAKDCKAIKATFADSADGVYWIDVTAGNTNDAFEVFCDMTHDGGGWTFVAFKSHKALNDPIENLQFFEQAVGDYQVSRVVTADHYSLGILPELNDTEMMIVGQSPDAQSAKQAQRFAQFKYAAHAPMFNFGPMPCTPSSFAYQTAHTEGYVPGKSSTHDHCDESFWSLNGLGNRNGDDMIISLKTTWDGLRMGSWVHNESTYKNVYDVWFYVR